MQERDHTIRIEPETPSHIGAAATSAGAASYGFEAGGVPQVELDRASNDVRVFGRPANLTRTEFSIMSQLTSECDRIVAYDTLLEQIWGAPYRGARHLLQVHMQRLRLKLEALGAPRDVVRNRWGVGYMVNREMVRETSSLASDTARRDRIAS